MQTTKKRLSSDFFKQHVKHDTGKGVGIGCSSAALSPKTRDPASADQIRAARPLIEVVDLVSALRRLGSGPHGLSATKMLRSAQRDTQGGEGREGGLV